MRIALFSVPLALWFLAAPLDAQTPRAGEHPDFSGYWELRYDSMSVPPAALTPDAATSQVAQRAQDLKALSTCEPAGVPALMADRAPLDLQQSASVIGIVAKMPSSTRYLYLDGRPHPPLDEYDPTTNGHSIGMWDGDTLVVTTMGFSDRGLRMIPGGGFRTSESRLTERYRLLNDGQRLSVTFSWDDPKIFQRPHAYEYRYYRVKDIPLPRMYQCNPADPERTRFLTQPK